MEQFQLKVSIPVVFAAVSWGPAADENLGRIDRGMRKSVYLISIGLLCLAPGFADTLELTGVQGGVMGGVYTSPYIATIDGQPALVICDDYTTNSYLWDPFTTYPATSVASLTGGTNVKFDTGNASEQETNYAVAAYLAEEILQEDSLPSPSDTQLGYYSYALWDIFDPGLLPISSCTPIGGCQGTSTEYGSLSAAQVTGAWDALTDAEAHAAPYTQYANVLVYTPDPKSSSQEFLVVDAVPEPSSMAMLGAALAGLAAMALRRKRLAA